MSYAVRKSDPSLTFALRRIARGQMEAAIAEIDDPALGPVTTVHQLRKRCKKLRGLIRLVRPGFAAYAEENAAFRDLARDLSELRDAGAVLETVTALEERFGETVGTAFFETVRTRLAEANPPADEALVTARLAAARAAFEAAILRTETWDVKGKAPEILSKGVTATYKRAISAMAAAAESDAPEDFHEFRKRVKYHWYQMRLLKRIWPKVIHARIGEARTLADELGDHHDLAIFRLTVLPSLDCKDDPVCEVLGGLIEAEEVRLEPHCLKHGRRLFAEDAHAFGERVAAYWRAWKD
ncbi:MAG: CHAD domain-containing protein [Hyphomonas sp.]|nr:CHAD domain-containing protein [Hyphomonas sp.]HRX72801.1 CHAD domain-containing protein [Hyphomonas sp.]